jgi:hypothetical protein
MVEILKLETGEVTSNDYIATGSSGFLNNEWNIKIMILISPLAIPSLRQTSTREVGFADVFRS